MPTRPARRRRRRTPQWAKARHGGSATSFPAGATRRAGHRLEDQHLGNGPAVLFLCGRVHAVGPHVDDEAMNFLWNPDVLDFAESIGVVYLKDRDRAATAGDIDTTEPWVELDDVRALRHRQSRDHPVRLEIEHGKNVVALARQERAPSLRVDGHPVVTLTARDRIAADDAIRARIDDREDVLVLEVDVDLS